MDPSCTVAPSKPYYYNATNYTDEMTAFFGMVAIGYGVFGAAASKNFVGLVLGAVSAGVGVTGLVISYSDFDTLHGRC